MTKRVAYLFLLFLQCAWHIQEINWRNNPRVIKVFHESSYGIFMNVRYNFKKIKLHIPNQRYLETVLVI